MAKKRNNSSSSSNSKSAGTTQSVASQGSNSSEQEVVTLDLQNLLTPLAIVISGIMISATLFFSLRGVEPGNDVQGTTSTTVADSGDSGSNNDGGAAPAPSQETFEAAEISIDDDPILGDKKAAKVAIVEFSDFECPFCARHWEQTHGSLVESYVDSGEAIIVYRDMPLSFHPQAEPAAIAANCAREQGGDDVYFEYHDKIFQSGVANGDSDFDKYAQDMGLNMDKFNDCQDSGKYDDEIQNDIAEGNAQGCTGTPCFIIGELSDDGKVINGKKVAGAYPFATFQGIIDELL